MNVMDEETRQLVHNLEAAIAIPEVAKPLPIPVQKFCGEVSKNFSITANELRATARRLETAANELKQRAEELEQASPDLRTHIERWISYERESNERGKFLNTLFEPPAKG